MINYTLISSYLQAKIVFYVNLCYNYNCIKFKEVAKWQKSKDQKTACAQETAQLAKITRPPTL